MMMHIQVRTGKREQVRTSLHGQVYGLGRLRILEGLGHLGQELDGKCM